MKIATTFLGFGSAVRSQGAACVATDVVTCVPMVSAGTGATSARTRGARSAVPSTNDVASPALGGPAV